MPSSRTSACLGADTYNTRMTPQSVQAGRFLTAEWRCLAMVNFRIDAAVLAPYVPGGVELDFFRGQAYLSVVGFRFLRTRVLGIPALCHRNFDEVNLRFYVRRRVGSEWRRGVVFIKEIVCRRLIAWFARHLYNENYVVMPLKSRVELPGDTAGTGSIRYEWHCGRRWHSVSAELRGEPILPEPGSEEEFVTEHYWGYSRQKDGGTLEYEVEHPRWRVWQAVSPRFDADPSRLYASEFGPFLTKTPSSAFVADGSGVVVRKGRQISC